ncbi:MAG TPA: hypothetical protein VH760_09855 [Gaiellaceae bacterium]|jgi:hypothetical protein
MSPKTPDFFELVGDEGTPEELAQLRRAHDLLVAAGPPPELSPRLAEAPKEPSRSSVLPRRRRGAAFLLAAAVVASAFGIGLLIGDRGSPGFTQRRAIPMHGVGRLASARATLGVGDQDSAGNYPLKMTVSGLPPLENGGWYELLLSKGGRPTLSCGSFAAAEKGVTVRLSVPYDLSKFPKLFDGWVVVAHRPARQSRLVMTT